MSMYFNSLSELWAMDGHGPFVWSAYLIVAVTLILVVHLPLARHRQTLQQLRRRLQREGTSSINSSASAGGQE